jgi:hypothetical protein
MRAQLLEISFVAVALIAAVVSVTTVSAGSELGPASGPGYPGYPGGPGSGYPGGGAPTGPYPGSAIPPVWQVLEAPTHFPWWRMPTLPASARWESAAPVFVPPLETPEPPCATCDSGAPADVSENAAEWGKGHGR